MVTRMIRDTLTIGFLLITLLLTGCWSSESNNRSTQDGKWKTISGSPTNGASTSSDSDNKSDGDVKGGGFSANLPPGFVQPSDDVGRKLLKEYGAVFIAKGGATPPNTVVFRDEKEVAAFQASVSKSTETIGGVSVELQSAALKALKEAVSDASQNGVSITPRGADATKRTYKDTVGLWASRVDPGLSHWSASGRISAADAQRIHSLSPFDQVAEIFKLESQGIYFAKDFSKSIIYSVAPPGSSQHLSMLALDVSEHDNSKVRAILAKHGWFQTVVSDLPHFTFLGVADGDLPKLGLKKVTDGGRVFWVPAI
jgi:hypothetical protein